MTKQTKSLKDTLVSLETFLDLYLNKKAPSIPANIKEYIVKYLPYLILVVLFFSIPSLLALFGLGSLFTSIGFIRHSSFSLTYQLSVLVMVVSLALTVIALPGLFKRSQKAWQLMFYSGLVNALYSLITFNLGNLIIGSLLGFYLLFQIRSYYK